MWNVVKVYTFLWGIHSKKNQEVEFRQTKSDLAILMFKVTLSEGSSFTYTES